VQTVVGPVQDFAKTAKLARQENTCGNVAIWKRGRAKIVKVVQKATRELGVAVKILVIAPPVQTVNTNQVITVWIALIFRVVRQENIDLDTTLPKRASADHVKRESTRILTDWKPAKLFCFATQDNI
tara:strand:- start:11343 stop:11723 length:381 start_codon:yes stop_codon:yes gene_type:complete